MRNKRLRMKQNFWTKFAFFNSAFFCFAGLFSALLSSLQVFPVLNKNASEVVPQIDGANSREKEEVTKQLKRLEEKGRGKYKTWTLAEKVEIMLFSIV